MSGGRAIDSSPADGFEFSCRPDCGLCCYASPALRPGDLPRLVAIEPTFRPDPQRPTVVPSRPEGGSCRFLDHNRCSVHPGRPGPCAEFPLATHLSDRVQVTVVLSCPGVRLDRLASATPEAPHAASGIDRSLHGELAAVQTAVDRLTDAELRRSEQRWRRSLATRRLDEASLRGAQARARASPPGPRDDDLAAVPIPSEDEGLDRLPLFFDPRYGRVALAGGSDQVHLLVVREEGGVDRRLASFPYPDRLPRLGDDATERLRAYLRLVAGREAFVGAELANMTEPGEAGWLDQALADLREIAAAVIGRAIYRVWLSGGSAEELDRESIDLGIRATDADYLDRPTVGRWL